jgi:hypothetical protein
VRILSGSFELSSLGVSASPSLGERHRRSKHGGHDCPPDLTRWSLHDRHFLEPRAAFRCSASPLDRALRAGRAGIQTPLVDRAHEIRAGHSDRNHEHDREYAYENRPHHPAPETLASSGDNPALCRSETAEAER